MDGLKGCRIARTDNWQGNQQREGDRVSGILTGVRFKWLITSKASVGLATSSGCSCVVCCGGRGPKVMPSQLLLFFFQTQNLSLFAFIPPPLILFFTLFRFIFLLLHAQFDRVSTIRRWQTINISSLMHQVTLQSAWREHIISLQYTNNYIHIGRFHNSWFISNASIRC